MNPRELALRYGCNPHQMPARAYVASGQLPVKVLAGSPGYINLLDALNSWQLVHELRTALDLPAAASFKHVSPAGAAVAVPLGEALKRAYFVDDMELSPLATAYARARGADRVSSYGDWIALSEVVDESTARLIRREVSDGIIAPGYEAAALTILREKKDGKYHVVEADPSYKPVDVEARNVFGVTLEQQRNAHLASAQDLADVVTKQQDLPPEATRDVLVALIALKYAQSNSVCLAVDGQVIGMGAGQQSRIHCTRLAASKADNWSLRQHPAVLDLRFRPGLRRPDRDNAIDQYLLASLTPAEEQVSREAFREVPKRLGPKEKQAWLKHLTGVALGSDAFIPFRDNIDRASASGVQYVAQPGGSLRDEPVIKACDEYGMVMAFTGVRLFHH
ncbi:MAG: 5-aminoimidazole-4-carboxamide ribonucleotide transformylase [Dehalococcoidia bacterium]|nr:5-aminoimidazole-4-carboxamide ribonucleotide transformylase [Dehalococcoidia bacterium]